ncbi:protein of unknown function (DUF4919) [Apibacter mensalis]|uniref:DUF4919 domain-containing protein n=1 Tax=Apibacter mensalis TaxID=1586267 RepID=A0A0X3ARD0_9FLAO|nr:DUF4919 domain-containing protein [Apibacter mensalis]CVK16448.1 protein of unknown function (DUF4919) [Apibacter mensalis]
MKFIYFILPLLALNFAFSQQINFEQLKAFVNDKNSPFYYDHLIYEFLNDTSAFHKEYQKSYYLYYGKLFSSYKYKSSELKPRHLKFMKQLASKKYAKAVILGEELLKNDPINLTIILNLIICYSENNQNNENDERLKLLKNQAEILMKAIADYGDGKNINTAFKVISLSDEFSLLNYLGINLEMYSRNSIKYNLNTVLDIWTKEQKYQKDKRNKIFIEVFTDISTK